MNGVEGSEGGGGNGAPVEALMGATRSRMWIMWFAAEWAFVVTEGLLVNLLVIALG